MKNKTKPCYWMVKQEPELFVDNLVRDESPTGVGLEIPGSTTC